MMRESLYKAVKSSLKRVYETETGYDRVKPGDEMPEDFVAAIRHIDLWNRNVEFAEQEEPWERPAVFIEFAPVYWRRIKETMYRSEPFDVKLHIVTDWTGGMEPGQPEESCLKAFVLHQEIGAALEGLNGPWFDALELWASHTNHDHEDLLESIEVFRTRGYREVKK